MKIEEVREGDVSTRISNAVLFMKKPKPWKNPPEVIRDVEKTRNLHHFCRILVAKARSKQIFDSPCVAQTNKRTKRKKGPIEPPFLFRNLLKAQEGWSAYEKAVKQWVEKLRREGRLRKAIQSSDAHQRDGSGSSILNQGTPVDRRRAPDSCPSSSRSSQAPFNFSLSDSDSLLRSFYTIWHIGRISNKSLCSTEEVRDSLKKLSMSAHVEKSLSKIPMGGIPAEVIRDRSTLSGKALLTLSRWARIVNDCDDGDESGYEEDYVEVWNRSVEMMNQSSNSSATLLNETAEEDGAGKETQPPSVDAAVTVERRAKSSGSSGGREVAESRKISRQLVSGPVSRSRKNHKQRATSPDTPPKRARVSTTQCYETPKQVPRFARGTPRSARGTPRVAPAGVPIGDTPVGRVIRHSPRFLNKSTNN